MDTMQEVTVTALRKQFVHNNYVKNDCTGISNYFKYLTNILAPEFNIKVDSYIKT